MHPSRVATITRLESCLDQPVDLSVREVVKFMPSPLSGWMIIFTRLSCNLVLLSHAAFSDFTAKHYDADTTEPISCGLRTMEELLSWKRSEANPFNVAVVPLAPRDPPLARCPRRTLVSHDMMGGYIDDRFIQGTNAETPYSFYHWQYIDIFNYFSHVLVTIPPVVWTNAAHKHGVVVLGTFITEWTDGAAMCEAFLKDEESYRAVADKLVQISHCYGFDGWLVNIENALSEVAVKNTPLFLRYLTDQMHERVSGSLVVWYDSVIENGQLKWQNELNQSNRMFFDACDGFFTNYNWTEQSLEFMKDYSGAQRRQADIYVGVDVFARGQVVGGMFETNKALELIRKHNFSTAIFAPGWVYETHDDKSEFRKNQNKFWGLLSNYLYVHRPASPLPFISSFCQGFGKAVYWRGQPETKGSWFNLTAQEIQPLYYHQNLEAEGWLRTSGCPEDAWNGGCSLLLDGVIPATRITPVCAKIFSLQVPLALKTLVTFIFKASPGITVSLELKTTDASQCTHVDVQEVTSILTINSILDTAGLQVPPELIQGLCIDDVVWLRGAGSSPQSSPSLRLNATLRWDYPVGLVRHFRVYWRRLRGPDPRIPPGQLVAVGQAYSNLFRVTELVVPEPPALLELVVEPVIKKGFLVPESHWGRRSLSYTADLTQ
uniref:Cytosolic endo-beta-N-acetylglucosaminidase n=1 Tax=Amphiprion ocellaris TaxID=80972 RepID=A0AAQ5Y978_AMPOC